MKKYLIQYKPFLLFLGKFALTYLILTFVYQGYLSRFDEKAFEVDGLTQMVAKHTEQILLFFNADARLELHSSQPCVKLFYNQKFVARIIEGCNAVSVIILFASFIVAFSGKWKHLGLYVLGGSLLIYFLNISRIALLAMLLFYYPEQEPILHGVFFPAFIYGIVFLLWVIWVNKFSFYAKKNVSK